MAAACASSQLLPPPVQLDAPVSASEDPVAGGDGALAEAEDFVSACHCSELSWRQNEQRKMGLFCDITLAFGGGGEFRAHRSVLAAATDYFTPLLSGHFEESRSGRVEMRKWSSEPGPDLETVEAVIQYMYTGKIRVYTGSVHEVLELADRFLLIRLKEFCGEFLKKKLNLSNCVAIHSLAHMYTLSQLALKAGDMIRRNFFKVIQDEEFYTLPFHLVRDWLSDPEITVDSEEVLFETVLKWVQRNSEERERYFEELFKLLRLSQMKPTYLTRHVKSEQMVARNEACMSLISEAVESHALRSENLQSGNLQPSTTLVTLLPRFGQNMDVIMVPELSKENVHMKNPEHVKEIIASLHIGGKKKLQVISDFDMTLSRFQFHGRRCPTSYNIIDNSHLVSEECRRQLHELFNTYYPLEKDPKRSVKEKYPLMVEWWSKAHDLLTEQRIPKEQIAQAVKESSAMLRDGHEAFFNGLYSDDVPLFIFSAGIGDVLEEILRQAGVFHPNVTVVSNYMDFDEKGLLMGFKGELIHTFNKNSSVLKDTEYFQQLSNRTNVILLGDTLGDLTMADGVSKVDSILKIGFLNDKADGHHEAYVEAYDIVLESEETLDVVNGILQFVNARN
ncbi:uncharacterized protein LOC115074368 isoform X3 [Rhinatrema bivittatum]|uniref:uncharacterized protein LOC115074368 isoform X3 n=1 Tax=Rhinatrema bivittatum TaxID=194408 RepID=UPI0011288EC6|nr:uncharacterized protein LOC115074368 isoform X3 [Rhinatrema bivittatum]